MYKVCSGYWGRDVGREVNESLTFTVLGGSWGNGQMDTGRVAECSKVAATCPVKTELELPDLGYPWEEILSVNSKGQGTFC